MSDATAGRTKRRYAHAGEGERDPMTPTTPSLAVGDVITTTFQLDTLPDQAIVRTDGRSGTPALRFDGMWFIAGITEPQKSDALLGGSALTLIYLPDTSPAAPTAEPEWHRALGWDDLKPYEQEQGGYWLYWCGATHGSDEGKTFVRVSAPTVGVDREALARQMNDTEGALWSETDEQWQEICRSHADVALALLAAQRTTPAPVDVDAVERTECTHEDAEVVPRCLNCGRSADTEPDGTVTPDDAVWIAENAATIAAARAESREEVGTGASEAADPDASEATVGVTRSVDYPEAPAQAHLSPVAVAPADVDVDAAERAARRYMETLRGEPLPDDGWAALRSPHEVNAMRAALAAARVGEAEDGEWTAAEWRVWADSLAALLPEDWDGDEDQTDIIERFVRHAARAGGGGEGYPYPDCPRVPHLAVDCPSDDMHDEHDPARAGSDGVTAEHDAHARLAPELVVLLDALDADAENDNYCKGDAAEEIRAALRRACGCERGIPTHARRCPTRFEVQR